jgi:hypothetical protein
MPAIGVSTACVPTFFPHCPTCNNAMEFVSITPTCQSVIYGYACRTDGDRIDWVQQTVVRRERQIA